MIQLIPEGPEIPEEIWFELENNNLVLFCGAGISKSNGLPLFNELVKKVCEKLCVDVNESPLKEFYERGDYDGVLDLVENQLVKGHEKFLVSPKTLRKKVIEILNDHKGKPEIHKALLDLSALPNNKGHRLVTTNFDRLFFEAGLNSELSDSAPKLAPPRKKTWRHLTFLHGVIDEQKDPAGESLVLTKKDFGLAYLHDNWASRFIIQLFQDFTVLFIGYSVNDPVMNYLISAISYERQRRKDEKEEKDQSKIESSIYAFVGYEKDHLEEIKNKWESIGVNPIPYNKTKEDHSLLYRTIEKWADLKKKGLTEKEHLLEDKVKHPYKDSDKGDGKSVASFLKLEENLAKFFSRRDPPFDISWLKPISENRLLDKLVRPPYEGYSDDLVPLWESLSKDLEYKSKSILYMPNWLCRYLDKRKLIYWVIDQGCILHPVLKIRIKQEIENRSKNKSPLTEEISLFWKTVASDNYNPQKIKEFKVSDLIKELNENYCEIRFHELLKYLEPYIAFEKYHSYHRYTEENSIYDRIYKPSLQVKYNRWPTEELSNEILLRHAEDFTDLLKNTMKKALMFKIIESHRDSIYFHRPSIAEDYEQNREFYFWTYIINLTRNSFDVAMEKDKSSADLLLEKWRLYPYPVFYRLILYAVTKYHDLDEGIAINLLKNEKKHVLWSFCCQKEVLEYLRKRKHSKKDIETLQSLIMKDAPRNLLNIDDEEVKKFKKIYKRLNCFKEIGLKLPQEIEEYYNKLQQKFSSQIGINNNQRSFSVRHWGLEPEFYVGKKVEDIFKHIKKPAENELYAEYFEEEKRKCFEILSKKDISRAFEVLLKFSNEDKGSIPYWNSFLEVRNEYFLKSLKKLEKYNDEDEFKKWWHKLRGLSSSYQDLDHDIPTRSLNSDLGKLTESVFNILWNHYFHKTFKKDEKIPKEIKEYFEVLIEENVKQSPEIMFHFGTYLFDLWYLDRQWIEENIKPLMDWNKDKAICQSLWIGYTYHAKMNLSFLECFKDDFYQLFLNRAKFYEENKNGVEAISDLLFITTGGKWTENIFSEKETKKIKSIIDKPILESISMKIWMILENSGDKSSVLWSEEIKPWIKKFWRKQISMKSHEIACKLSMAILHCGDKMPDAFKLLEDEIKGNIKKTNFHLIDVSRGLEEGRFKDILKYPNELLNLLDWNIPESTDDHDLGIGGFRSEIKKLLEKVREKNPEIEERTDLYRNLYERL